MSVEIDPNDMPALFHEGVLQPRSYATDAGIDLATSEDTWVPARGGALIPTGNLIQIPPGTFGLITNRSSSFGKFGLMVFQGVIDEGFVGELYASVFNLTDADVLVQKGDRVCQFLLLPNMTAMFRPVQVEKIEAGERGGNGFGSTGHTNLRVVP